MKNRTFVALILIAVGGGYEPVTLGVLAQSKNLNAAEKDPGIRILDASFGDQIGKKTCKPDLSICKDRTICEFTVTDMCPVDSTVKNLEVIWDCGKGTVKKTKAAAKGTKMTLKC
jgi:hypothetical protein